MYNGWEIKIGRESERERDSHREGERETGMRER